MENLNRPSDLYSFIQMQEKYQLDHSLDTYIEKLVSFGIKVNKKLQPAVFYLKNGLPYPGLLTTEEVSGHEDLVEMPIDLLLTSHKAMKEPELAVPFSNKFYKQGLMWQDRILVTYILFLLSKDQNSIWTHMAKQFSKDIDIVSFWEEKEFDCFVDSSVLKAAKKERSHFEHEWSHFQEIQDQYPILYDKKWFNRDNYKWIYIHTISRCFGSFLKSTYFVPLCELFNHHCVDVSYACVNQTKTEPQASLDSEDNASQSSVSSGYSEDYLSDDDFDYLSINSYIIKWGHKISYDLNDKQTKIIQKALGEIYSWIDKELQLKGFTLLYLGQMIQKLKIFQNQYKAGRQRFQQSLQRIEEVKLALFGYKKYLVELYRYQGRQYQRVKNQRGVESTHVDNQSWAHYQKTKEQCKQVYTHFKMEARDHAYFPQKSQIYFSYGKLSNRTLLVRYGFSLEENLYEHVWLKFKLGKHIEPYPDLFEMIQNKGLSVNYKLKLKSYTLALEPIVYTRMLNWKATHHSLQDIFFITDIEREISVLVNVKQLYFQQLKKYANINVTLEDKDIGYHAYFVRVYNKQKKKILEKQLQVVVYLISVFERVISKEMSVKTLEIKEEYKKYLKHYVKGLRGVIDA